MSDAAGPDGLVASAVFRPVREGNAFEETVERLRQAIRLGLVARGERLPPERELAPRLGIGRATLREAIRALRKEGYVESRRGRFGGTFVTYEPAPPRRGDLKRVADGMGDRLHDALVYRMAVETGAVQVLAGRRPGEGGAERLRECLAEADRAAPDDHRRHDTRFHLLIGELTGSPTLAAACADARMRLNDLLGAIPVLRRNIEHSAAQHAAIVDAIAAGDADAARRAVAEHLASTGSLLRGFLT